jgi:hypothetical protein
MIPYSEVAEKADRRWTARLVERLGAADLAADELQDLVCALQAVSDPRSVGPLEALLCETGRPSPVREAASAVLAGMHHLTVDVPQEKLRRWWNGCDIFLRRHALSCMDAIDCPDVVLQVAADPAHELHAEAVGRMEFFFDRPEHEALKVAALAHPLSRVREAAADVLLWDEPVRAEEPLIRAARDPVAEVAAAAANTLEYYPSLKALQCLYGLLDHPADRVREEALESYEAIRDEVLICLQGKDCRVAEHVRQWLWPVWDLLTFADDEVRPCDDEGTVAGREKQREAIPLVDLLALLADPDASPLVLSERLWDCDWAAYGGQERKQLRPALLRHPDPVVRERSALALEAWRDVAGLVALVSDGDLAVSKSAMYWLGELPPAAGVAALAWDHLHRRDVLGVHATETLGTFVQHADAKDAVGRLGWIAGDHGYREGLRAAAIGHLADLGAAEQVGELAGLLAGPPEVTWALHLALLHALADLGLPCPDSGQLRGTDNLRVQAALARWVG